MALEKETWKWALVVVLLAVFILLAKQAFISLTKDQDIPPPTDYLQGDTYDKEHKAGPGAGQPIEVPGTGNTTGAPSQQTELPPQPKLDHSDPLYWDRIDEATGTQ